MVRPGRKRWAIFGRAQSQILIYLLEVRTQSAFLRGRASLAALSTTRSTPPLLLPKLGHRGCSSPHSVASARFHDALLCDEPAVAILRKDGDAILHDTPQHRWG